MSASLLTMQPCSTAMMGNLLSSVDAFNILLIIYDCCLLIRRVIRFRERILRGCCRAANSFISPWLPYLRFSVKVSHTSTVAADTPKPMQIHCPTPAIYMMTNITNTASRPAAKINRYCARSPLNSTSRPTPLFISKSAISYCLFYVFRGRTTSEWWRRLSERYRLRTTNWQFYSCRGHPN